MKMQIRRGTFETNSSSVHSLTMCTANEFQKWRDGEVLFWGDTEKFATKEQIISELKNKRCYDGISLYYPNTDWNDDKQVYDIFSDESIKSFDKFFEDNWYETYWHKYTSVSGDEIIAFGYYGHD